MIPASTDSGGKSENSNTVFEFTEEKPEEQILDLLNQITEEDRLLVLVLDYGLPDDPSAGSSWLRWERLTKAMSTSIDFEKYEEWQLPLVVRMNCSDPTSLCRETMAGKADKVLIWTPGGKPTTFKQSLRKSDRSILNELLEWMQPAVLPLEHKDDVTDFVDSYKNAVVLFGADFDNVFVEAAHKLRDHARFGENNNVEVASHFGVSKSEMPAIILYRDFKESLRFGGDMDDRAKLTNWIRAQSVLPFGEYNYQTASRYFGIDMEVFWVYIDTMDDSFEDIKRAIFQEVYPMMRRNSIPGVFSYIDIISGAKMAKNMNLRDHPSVVALMNRQLSSTLLSEKQYGQTISRVVREAAKLWTARNIKKN